MSDQLNITLKIGVRSFPMTIRRSDEFAYREAEKLINERLRFYADRYPTQTNETYLMMTLLDVALQLKQNEERFDATPWTNALQGLLGELETHLGE